MREGRGDEGEPGMLFGEVVVLEDATSWKEKKRDCGANHSTCQFANLVNIANQE